MNIFTWMFKSETFKEHIRNLFMHGLLFYVVGGCFLGTGALVFKGIAGLILIIIGIVLFVCPNLLIQGYYWCLTENIIDRRADVEAKSVYDGKINTIEKFDLPEYDISKFVWRGVASTIALLIMILPVAALLAIITIGGTAFSEFWGLGGGANALPFVVIGLLFVFLSPALLWNYAKRDSVIAVLNFRKAIYIIGNYPMQYIKNVILMVLISIVIGIISGSFQVLIEGAFGKNLITASVSLIVLFFINLYSVFVISYLHGTIAPVGEGV